MDEKIIFFDGVCNFCHSSVQFIIKRDPKRKFRFAALQSETAQKFIPAQFFSGQTYESVVLYDNGKIYDKSSAALRIAKELSGLWPMFYLFLAVPKPIRDWVYDFIAVRRDRWFGKKESCEIPSVEDRARFI